MTHQNRDDDVEAPEPTPALEPPHVRLEPKPARRVYECVGTGVAHLVGPDFYYDREPPYQGRRATARDVSFFESTRFTCSFELEFGAPRLLAR